MSSVKRETACMSIGTLGCAGTGVSIVWRLRRIARYRAESGLSARYHNKTGGSRDENAPFHTAVKLQSVTTVRRL